MRKCNDANEAKMHEALLIKKQNPTVNKQMYANGAFFLFSVHFLKCALIFTVIAYQLLIVCQVTILCSAIANLELPERKMTV